MKLLYLNNELAVADGCNAHALGMLCAMERIIGKDNIYTFPHPEDCSRKIDNKKISSIKDSLASLLQVVRYCRKTIKSITLANKIYRDMKSEGFNPTHIWVRSSVFERAAVILAKKTGAKLICEMNTPFYYEWCVTRKLPLKKQVEKWERYMLNKADYIYVVSERLRLMYNEYYGVPNEKMIVIPNGYDRELYADIDVSYSAFRKEVRNKEQLQGKFVVTFIGSLKVWHGIDKFCELADQMKENSQIHFMVLGDGEMRPLIEQYVSHHNNMTFVGKVDYQTMKKYIYASDLGIMPYNIEENFYFSPLKMYDMIGGKLPFIGTDIGQISDICKVMLTKDFLVRNNEWKVLESSIYSIVDNKDKYESMKKALNDSHKEFTWDYRAMQLIDSIGMKKQINNMRMFEVQVDG